MNISLRKKLGIFVILAALPISVFAAVNGYGSDETYKYFTDVKTNHPFVTAINALKEKGFVAGYGNDTFAPDQSISRAEFITMLMTSAAATPKGEKCFKDVSTEWFAKFVCGAKTLGFVSGYSDGTFGPDKNITFAEASAIVANVYKLRAAKAAAGTVWYKPYILKLSAKKAIPVSIDYVEKKLSRGEVAEMIWRLKTKVTNKPTKTFASLSAQMPKIASCAELKEKFEALNYKDNRYQRDYLMKAMPLALMEESAAPMAVAEEEGAAEDSQSSSADFSSTNIQVEGVDEGDIVKNDGEFIYVVSKQTVRIVKAYPPQQMEEISKIKVEDENFNPSDLYITANKLVVLGSTYASSGDDYRPYWSSQKVKMYVFNTADKSNIKEERSIEFDGTQISSRKIGNRIYLIMNNNPDYSTLLQDKEAPVKDILPRYKDSNIGETKPLCGCSDVHFLPQYDQMNFVTVASIDIENGDSAVDKQVVMGAGNNVYASTQSIYVAAQRYEYPTVEKFDVFAAPAGQSKTAVFRFALDNGVAKFESKGEIPGTILNQFSMDEESEAFRIATTTGEVWSTGENASKNHLYILDKSNLETVLGKIENIAQGEKIYSVRFLGKRAYMVTFKKVDPFFVIDVEDPKNPKILGELKIPGFSDYLHPYDENHIIGFGKEAVDPQDVGDEWPGRDFDFAWYQGMKIALFDVTDVANPTMMFKEVIGDRGTESELLYDHKALLYDKARGLFAFPVTVAEIKDKQEGSYSGSQYGETVFQGAYVYTLNLTDGFKLKGKITHFDETDEEKKSPNFYWYDDNKTIRRIVYIGDYLYTISSGKLKAVKREDMTETKVLQLEASAEPPAYEILPLE